jgi:hypothetical protein
MIEYEGSEEDFKQLRALAEEGKKNASYKKLLDDMGNNPKTRELALRIIKEVRPNMPLPELDAQTKAAALIDAKLKPVLDKLEAKEKKEEEEKLGKSAKSVDDLIDRGRKWLKEEGYSKEGIESVESLMQSEGLTNYEAAASLWERRNPKDESVVSSLVNAFVATSGVKATDEVVCVVGRGRQNQNPHHSTPARLKISRQKTFGI